MFYYIILFESVTPNIIHIIAKTNQGYINSKIPMRVKIHCIEKATINDPKNNEKGLEMFSTMKKSIEELRNTADGASLFGRIKKAQIISLYIRSFSSFSKEYGEEMVMWSCIWLLFFAKWHDTFSGYKILFTN